MRQARVRAYRSGLFAETLAALLLRLKGHRVVARRYKTPVGEIDLEFVVPEAFGVAQDDSGRFGKGCGFGGPAAQRGFGLGIAPRLVRYAPERETRLLDRAAIELEADRD